jgi:hypothetical protein
MSIQQWEYEVLRVNLSENDADKAMGLMNSLGNNGWELVAAICAQVNAGYIALYHFKRPIEWKTVVDVQQA